MRNEPPLNIAMLCLHSNPLGDLGTEDTGGMSVYVRELSLELGRAGHPVDIYTRMAGETHYCEVRLSGNVRIINLPIRETGHIPKEMLHAHLPELFEALKNYKMNHGIDYDIIHSHYWLSARVGNWARSHWNIPHVLMFHTIGIVKKIRCSEENEPPIRLITEKRLSGMCDRIIAPTAREREFLSRYYEVPDEKTGIVPCGVNLKRFRPVSREKAREQIGLAPSEPVVLYVGRFTPIKGLEGLLNAAALLLMRHDLRLILAGGSSDEEAVLRGHAKRLGILNKVIFAGRVSHDFLPVYYSAANVLAVPSHYESFGLVALECLACGTPVVSTRVGVADDIIIEGQTGHIIDTQNPRMFADALDDFLAQDVVPLSLTEEIRSSVSGFSWERVAAMVIDEYITATSCHDNYKNDHFPVTLK